MHRCCLAERLPVAIGSGVFFFYGQVGSDLPGSRPHFGASSTIKNLAWRPELLSQFRHNGHYEAGGWLG